MTCLVLAMSGTSALLGWIDPSTPGLAGRTSPRRVGTNSIPTPRTHALSLQQIESLVQSVVAEASDLRPARWKSVDVLAGPATGRSTVSAYPNSMLLAAKPTRKPRRAGDRAAGVPGAPEPTQFHFRIDPHGRPFATDAWIRQVALAQDPNAIAIQVTRPGEGQAMTPSQWQCVRSLISELSTLRQSWQAPARRGRTATASILPMRMHEDWSDVYSAAKAGDRS